MLSLNEISKRLILKSKQSIRPVRGEPVTVDRKLVTRPRDRLVQPSNGTMQSYAVGIGLANLRPLISLGRPVAHFIAGQ